MSSWDGTLSLAEFYVAACAFAEQWKEYNAALPQWSWVSCPRNRFVGVNNVDGYLSLENVVLPKPSQEDDRRDSYTGLDECCCSNEDEGIDATVLVQMDVRERHYYDFHIVYSASYKVPVVYFRAYYDDGQPLALNVIEKEIYANSREELRGPKWMFMTQEEHPYLYRPWCMLHPCGTGEQMKLLFSTETSAAKGALPVDKYLVSWFTVVGQVFGFKIPLQMLGNVNSSG